MKLLAFFLAWKKKTKQKTLKEYQEEMLIKIGRQQFKRLKELGLTIPVALG